MMLMILLDYYLYAFGLGCNEKKNAITEKNKKKKSFLDNERTNYYVNPAEFNTLYAPMLV